MSILGTRVVRVEDPVFLTQGGTYTDDLTDERLAGALHVTFVRSTLAHARITEIDVSAARAAPGVIAVVTAVDFAELAPIPPQIPLYNAAMVRPWLASEVVRFVGEPVAAVLTEERYQGEDAAELVDIDYDPLPAVIDPRAAAADEVLLFPDAGTNTVVAFGHDTEPDPNLFDGCEVVVSQEIVNQRVAAVPLETRAAAAVWENDRCTLWCSTQNPQTARDEVSGWLGLTAGQLRIITPDVGGGFGAKIGADPEFAIIAWLARRLGRPVRWAESRSENMIGMVQGRGQLQTITIGGRRDGTVLAYRLDVIQDSGSYPRFGPLLPMFTRMMAPGVYAIPKVETRTRSVATTTTSIAAYRGAGRPEATTAIERAMDLFAAEIGKDPAEVRKLNVIAPEKFPFTTSGGATYDSGEYAEAIDRALEAAGYAELRAEQAARRERGDAVQLGIGVSAYVEITAGAGAHAETASLEVHPDGSATVLTGTSPHGQGHATAWAMLASDRLGIPVERITVLHGDTELIPKGGGTAGSRSLQTGGVAVDQAARELIDLAKQRAADLLEADPGDLIIENGTLRVKGAPGASVTLAALAERERLSVDTEFDAGGPTYPFGSHVAVVEVDTESGKVWLRRVVAVDDAGRVLNPLLAEGQRHGGIAQGAAQALMEHVRYDEDGNPTTATLVTYPMISATELPSFELVSMETETPLNPLGAKGIGEAGTIGAAPAVQNAVVDALSHLGVRHIDMPTTPERVWTAIQQAPGKENA
jgi:carbon-monoxide dehydrogenase large subunit